MTTRVLDLDRNSPVPLHYQLRQMLLAKIESGEWKPGDLIPSEPELQELYGLSRTTIRQALSELVFEGRLTRHRGKGTFVAAGKFTHSPNRLGLTHRLEEQGIRPGWRVLDERQVVAPAAVREALRINGRPLVTRIRRLRLADEEPIGIHTVYLPEAIAAQINRAALQEGESLRYLSHLPQMQGSRAHRTIEAVAATKADAKLLNVKPGSPILQIERVVVAADGTPLEYLQARYRGDRFKYQITL
ncbi:MAG: GntR family transcriptional regulator [Anaerolineales bacterium]|nr:GntR family transcriptional regulator [Anaerolineales bacterium]